MIATVTLNPMLDKTVSVEALRRGSIHRASGLGMVAGGKGINVSRQLKCFGDATLATGFLGGFTGDAIRSLLEAEGIRHDFVETRKLTREGVTYREADGTSTAVFEPSEKPEMESVHALSRKVDALAATCSWIACSGSSPGGPADDVFYEAVLSAHKKKCRSALDSYGPAALLALRGLPTLVKCNRAELESLVESSVRSERDVMRELEKFLEAGAEYAIVTDGPSPARAASKEGRWLVTPPEVSAVNPVGSGDTMLAGILHGLVRGWDFVDCLRFGASAGAANAAVWEVANVSLQTVEQGMAKSTVHKL